MTTQDFSNQPLAIGDLPAIDALVMQPLARRYRLARLLTLAACWLLLVAGLWLASIQPWVELATDKLALLENGRWLLLILGPLYGCYVWFAERAKGYALREQDLNFRSGLWFVNTVSQPITRIQHVELKQGPLERQLKLASLQVFSAGGVAHTFELPGLSLESARQIRQFILDHRDVGRHG